MEAYIISILMSWFPYLMGIVGIVLLLFFTRKTLRIPPFKTGSVLLFVSFFFAAFQPSNTYKVKADRLPNPPVSYSQQEPQKGVDSKLKLEENTIRKERFDDLIDWQGRIK